MPMDSILRVDMSDLSVKKEPIPAKWAKYAGRALTDAVVFDEVPPNADPLGPDNKLVVAPGLFGGTTAPNGGRLSFGAKSPLTGGIKESNSGGQMAHAMARMGIAALIVQGAPKDKGALYVLKMDESGNGSLMRADELAGLGNYDTAAALHAKSGDAKIVTITNGPAGEKLLKASGIAVSDVEGRPNRFAGRGGLGAVMGSKGLKAVVAPLGRGGLEHADKDAFNAAVKKFAAALKEHPVSGQGLPTFGTNVLVNVINEAGGFPTRNFSDGRFDAVEGISGETMHEIGEKRGANMGHGCHTGCVIRCSRYYNDADGNYVTKGPEYESAWSLGANCGIGDMDAVALLDRECSDQGLDTIEMGGALAVYMDAGKVAFGDGAGALAALKTIRTGAGDGPLLGMGTEAVGEAFGVKHIPVVKHQSLPAYDPRPIQGIGVTYATSTQGADHTAGYSITANVLGVGGTVDPLKTEGQAALSQGLQIATAMLDSFGLCIFVAFPVLDIPAAFEAIFEMAAAHTGDPWDADMLMKLGRETLTMERLYNEGAGFTAADDRLPQFFLDEKLPPHDVVFTVTDADLDSVFDFVPATAADMGITVPKPA
jgi:aldehyde:ferredoxin oxidoreductase